MNQEEKQFLESVRYAFRSVTFIPPNPDEPGDFYLLPYRETRDAVLISSPFDLWWEIQKIIAADLAELLARKEEQKTQVSLFDIQIDL